MKNRATLDSILWLSFISCLVLGLTAASCCLHEQNKYSDYYNIVLPVIK